MTSLSLLTDPTVEDKTRGGLWGSESQASVLLDVNAPWRWPKGMLITLYALRPGLCLLKVYTLYHD